MTDFSIKIFKDHDVCMGAKIALSAKLFVPGWGLTKILQYAKQKNSKHWLIAIGYLNDKPITVCVYENNYSYAFLAAFTKAAYRRNGYGSRVLQQMLKNVPNPIGLKAGIGISQSHKFWLQNNVCVV
jgi:hypothetical protein